MSSGPFPRAAVVAAVLAIALGPPGGLAQGPVFVPGFVPDWNQPYYYDPSDPNCLNGGPGPADPNDPNQNEWDAWCAPTSAANLVGHWDDYHGIAVADAVAFPGSAVMWATGPSWQDYLADGTAFRPDPNAGFPPPSPPWNWPTDIGYCMDTNNRGNPSFVNGPHAGTYLKDIHVGLLAHLQLLTPVTPALPWHTGTQGRGYAGGQARDGSPAVWHTSDASAFAEIVSEIKAHRTMIVCFTNWSICEAGYDPLEGNGEGEASYPVHFYAFQRGDDDPWGNDEDWNYDEGEGALGHAVTAVGYLLPNDSLNPEQNLNTPWVIVHDNVPDYIPGVGPGTPRNVAVPLVFPDWVANTNANFACPGDLDRDWDTDLSDLGIILADWGCTWDCVGDVDGDGDVDLQDLATLVGDWGCPDWDAGFEGEPSDVLQFDVVAVDNSAVGLGDDSKNPEFDGDVTHFTFDLQVTVTGGNDWTAAQAEATLSEPGLTFFEHSLANDTPPLGAFVNLWPALEFDSFYASTETNANNQPPLGDPGLLMVDPYGDQLRSAVWADLPPNGGGGVFTIARYTIVVPVGSGIRLTVVPPGCGGPALGTIIGAATSTDSWGGCNMFSFDIVRCPDFDGNGEVGLSDLGQLLANYGTTTGAAYEDGDLDGDGDVDLSDLAALLAVYGTTCP